MILVLIVSTSVMARREPPEKSTEAKCIIKYQACRAEAIQAKKQALFEKSKPYYKKNPGVANAF